MDFLLNLDNTVLNLINQQLTSPFFDGLFPMITDLHKLAWFQAVVVFMSIISFLYKFKLKKGLFVFFIFLIAVGSADFIGGQIIKKQVQRERPAETHKEVIVRSPYGGYSFPSNHALNMFCAASFLSRAFPLLTEAVYFMAILAAYSRIYNGVHYPSDVLFGAIAGFFWGLMWFKLIEKYIFREINKEFDNA